MSLPCKMKLHRYLLILLACWLNAEALAGTITAELDRAEGEVGDRFSLVVAIEGSRDGELELPEVDGLVIEQQGVQRSEIFNNGQRTSELQITYAIYPQRAGTFTIPSLAIELDGKREATLPLTLKVEAAKGQGGQSNQPQSAAGSGTKNTGGDETGGIFIERDCQNSRPYVGEQVLCYVRVYHRGNLNGGQRLSQSSPDIRRFSVEGERRYQRIVNGQRYGVIELREILVPTKAGSVDVPPYALEARILIWNKRNGKIDRFFDNFGGGLFNFNFTEEREIKIESEATTLDVQPTPEQGRPEDFTGLVGQFKLSATTSRNSVPVGDTVTITIDLSGQGVLDTIKPLQPAGVEALGKVYADKPDYQEDVDGDKGIYSKHTFKYALVPSKEGSYDLGQIKLSYFDPVQEQYQTLSSDLGTLVVEPGKAEAEQLLLPSNPNPLTQKQVAELARDLMPPHPQHTLLSKQTITKSFLYFCLIVGGIPFLAAFGLFIFTTRKTVTTSRIIAKRKSHAIKRFRQRLEASHQLIGQQKPSEGLAAAHLAMRLYFGDKLALHGAALTFRDIESRLSELAVPIAIQSRIQHVFNRLEAIEFGEQPISTDQAKEILSEVEVVLSEVEPLC